MSKPSKRKILVDFQKIELKDLSGQKLKVIDFHKTIANILYQSVLTLDMLAIAKKINEGGAVQLNKTQINEIKAVFTGPECRVVAFVRKAIIDYLTALK